MTIILLIYSHCASELSPVCAIVGGVIGQDIIKVCVGLLIEEIKQFNCIKFQLSWQ